jgi:competence protein ComEC
MAVLLFYGQLAGGGASVSRAVTAACVYLGGRMLDHRGPALNALAVAALAGLAVDPLAAFDGGFLLSFGATLGILVGAPRLRLAAPNHGAGSVERASTPSAGRGRNRTAVDSTSAARAGAGAEAGRAKSLHPFGTRSTIRVGGWLFLIRTGRRVGSAFAGLFIATACAEVALAPVGATLFSRITFAGLILNFAAVPLMAIVQSGGMATLAAAPVAEPAARVCGYVTHLAASAIVRCAGLVDVAPWLSRDVTPPTWWLVGAYYASCAALLLFPRFRRAGVCGITVSAALMLTGPAAVVRTGVPVRPPGALRVVFMDVGQGDATVAVLPDGRAMLVDAGGLAGSTFDIGGRVLAPSLRALGVRRLESLVLTHGDPDHIGGAPAALHRFEPRAIWEGVPVPPHPALRELAALASHAAVVWRTVQAGDREVVAGVEIRVLHPPPPEWERQRVRNDDSVVLELRFGDVSILLPGDIGVEGERQVVPRLDPGPLTIVKAPHHGSATSSSPAFIAAAHPAAVVFSEGRGNRFGHPAPPVTARYQAAKALMFRTDEDGAIVMDTDGKTVEITTWSGRHVTLRR